MENYKSGLIILIVLIIMGTYGKWYVDHPVPKFPEAQASERIQEIIPSPTASPTPTIVPGVTQAIKDVFDDVFDNESPLMTAISKCESSLIPERVHKDDKEWSVGLFQINMIKGNGNGAKVHADKIPGRTMEDKQEWLKNPMNNAIMARFIKAVTGLRAWTCYTNGVYKKYL